MDNKTKILIIRLSAIGDTIHTIPLACALKKAYPGCTVDWVVEDKAKHFVKNNPVVDNCFIIPRKKWKKRGFSLKNLIEFFIIIKNIKKKNYDIVIDTQQLLKSAIIMGLSGAKRKITHTDGREFSFILANEFVKSNRKQFDLNYHVVERNLDFARHLGILNPDIEFALPSSSEETVEKAKLLLKDINPQKPIIVISPATTWLNKHWKNEYWSKVIELISDEANILLTATNNDKQLIDSIIKPSFKDKIFNLTGKTNLSELTEIFKLSDIVISPDSGSAHIAWATQKPFVVTIFCATSKNRTAPFGEKYYSLAANLSCSPCMKKRCKLKIKKNICTQAVKPEEVIIIVNNILQSLKKSV